jgi:outer membrane protein OmpA-like peptidoglycan-associated protein
MKLNPTVILVALLLITIRIPAQSDSALAEILKMRQALNGMIPSGGASDKGSVTLHRTTYDSLITLLASQKQALDYSQKEIESIRKRLASVDKVTALTIETGTIYFAPGSYSLTNDAIQTIQLFVKKNGIDKKLLLEGYADPSGTSNINETLSRQRALAVRQYLITGLRINPEKIKTNSYGSNKRICETLDEGCNQRNRRVEIQTTP